MDGMRVIRRIRSTDALKNVPVIVLSACVTAETEAQSIAAGADFFLSKPHLHADLTRVLWARSLHGSSAWTAN